MRAALAIVLASSTATSSFAGSPGPWIDLFQGSTAERLAEHWRGYRQPGLPREGWGAEGGCLRHFAGSGGGDLVTRERFADFELELEWAISQAGNSGIFYRVSEDWDAAWMSGPEMQVLDDDGHPDGRNPKRSAGALYDLIAPVGKNLAPVGAYNRLRLVVSGNQVEHWLNGVRVVSYSLGSPEWRARVGASKFADQPGYGLNREGHIALQDHGDGVCFRNIRVRRL